MFLFLILVAPLRGQENKFGPCSLPVDWSNIHLNTDGMPAHAGKILIVTNRPYNPESTDGELFPNEISDFRKVTYLLATCVGGNWELYPAEDLFTGLNQIDNGLDILLFIDGHGKDIPLVLTRSNQIVDKYGVSLVVFDWPSLNSNFNKSLSRVRRCGDNFYNLLLQMKQYRVEQMEAGQHLSLLLHSLGNYFLTYMVVNGDNQYMDEKIFDNIIMNAAAVRSKEHGEVISQVRIQNRLYVVLNNRDRVLRGANLLTTGKMLGNEAMAPLAPHATYLDFTPVAGSEHTYFVGYHQFEYDLPVFNHFYHGAFHGEDVDLSNGSMFTPGTAVNNYLVNDN